jgi:hypothetical protein
MPLDVIRLLDSDLFAESNGDEFKAAVALWCKSWNQVPAASLPNKEVVLEKLSSAKNWKKIRDMAMHGWILCSDDRWYHPTVAEKALEAMLSRQDHADNKAAEKERKNRERSDRKFMFAQLRTIGKVLPGNTHTKELRKICESLGLPTTSHTNVTVTVTVTDSGHVTDGHGDDTAKRGTERGTGTGDSSNNTTEGDDDGSSPNSEKELVAVTDWACSERVDKDLEFLHSVDPQFIELQRAEFQLFWRDQKNLLTAGAWDAKFLQRVVDQWDRKVKLRSVS